MKITKLEPILIAIPFCHDGPAGGFAGATWNKLEYLIVRVETDQGVVGYGEAFGFGAIPGTKAILEQTVAPLVLGKEADDIAGLMDSAKKTLHVFGRSGPVQYALSGFDMALWDIAGKQAGLPLWRLLGGSPRKSVPVYASKLRLSEPRYAAEACARAVQRGFKGIKLHEINIDTVAAARSATGDDIALMLDVNCPWSYSEALTKGKALLPYQLTWLEEPIWPPEDVDGLARLRHSLGIPLAAGENAANAWGFKALADAVDILQPSITKIGVTEFMKVGGVAELSGRDLTPHSPYFGPGYLATLQMAAVFPRMAWVEYFSVELEMPIFADSALLNVDGTVSIPQGPGLGADPNPEVIQRYRVA